MSIHNLIQLHDEQQFWLHELDLYQDEIRYFQNRLARLSAQETGREEQKQIVHFRQEFLKALEEIDDHRQQIYLHEAQIVKKMELASRTKGQLAPDESHHKLRRSIEEFSLSFKALKINCQEYSSRGA